MITKGLGLIAVATAMLILASALKKMGNQSWESIGKGLLTLGGAMAILAIGLNAMKSTLAGSAALLVASLALAIFAPIFALLGAMSWKSIAKGLISIAGAFVILGVAGAVLGPIIPAILGLSAAMALVGVGILGVGVGMVAAGLGLTALAAGMTALAAAGVATATSFVAMLTVIITGVAQTIPTVAIMIAQGFLEFVRVIGENAPLIMESVGEILISLFSLKFYSSHHGQICNIRLKLHSIKSLRRNITKYKPIGAFVFHKLNKLHISMNLFFFSVRYSYRI